MDFPRDTWHLFLRHLRANLRMPVFLVISIVQPLLWVILFGQLFGALGELSGFGTGSYIQFLAPGIAVMTALFGAAYSGMGMLNDIDQGVLDRLLATPVHRAAIIASRVLFSAVQVIVQAGLILLAATFLGARPEGGVLGVLTLFLAAALLAAAFAGFSNALALLTRRQELIIAVMNFTVLPMTFLSSMMMAPGLMPRWIRTASLLNPVNWAVMLARGGYLGRSEFAGRGGAWLFTGLLLLFAFVCGALATRAFQRYRALG